MDKRTLLAVVLSVAVITVGFIIQSKFFMPSPEEMARQQVAQEQPSQDQSAGGTGAAESASGGSTGAIGSSAATGTTGSTSSNATSQPAQVVATSAGAIVPYGDDPSPQTIKLETEQFTITFDNRGAKAVSIKLNKHMDKDQPLEMVLSTGPDQGAFQLHFGGAYSPAVDAPFYVSRIDSNTIEFYRDFAVRNQQGGLVPFTIKKTFEFKPRDYLFELRVAIENSVNEFPPLDFNGYAYTLSYGPQIGPEIEELDGRYEYRKFYTYADGKRDQIKIKDGEQLIEDRVMWAALLGKYFTVIGIPDATQYDIMLSEKPMETVDPAHRMFFSRPLIRSSRNEDVFQFYVGPKLARELTRYNDPDENGFGTSDLHLEEVMDTGSILGWLEWILKRMLVLFHSLIPNWGIAILILTIVIKIVLYPFTHKSYQSTSKMQALAPKINELKAKYKDNPTKMNQEMANIYKSEGVNPLGGCLPLLLQMPIFIALYGLLNKHFDLRGAVFIPGWITDLSGPETIFSLPFSIPFLGSDIHLLPILFALTMVISTKTMQSPGAAGQQGSMKMMMYFMPLFLFFVLYSAPSGLLIYWIMTNVLTMFQQKATSKHRAKVEEEGGGDSAASAQKRSKVKHPQAVSASVSKNSAKKSAAQKGKGGETARKKKKK